MTAAIPSEHAEAIARFERYAGQDPDNTDLLVNLADLYHHAGRLEDAERIYRRVIVLQPGALVPRSRLAGVALSRNDFPAAEVQLRELVDGGARDPAISHNLGLALFYQDRFDEARHAFEEAAEGDAAPPRGLAYRAWCHHHLGEMEQAHALAKAWSERQSTPESHGYLALVEMDCGAADDAYRRAEAVLQADPENRDAAVVAGTSMLEGQQIERAAGLFRRALGRDPQNGRAWLGLGLVALYGQRYEEAGEALGKALEAMPSNGGVRVTLGWSYILQRDVPSAVRVFGEAVEVNRNFSEAHGGQAAAFALLGRHDEARKAVRRARGLDPTRSGGGFGAAFAQAILLDQGGDREAATELVEKALGRELRPGAPSLLESLQHFAKREAARGINSPPPGAQGV